MIPNTYVFKWIRDDKSFSLADSALISAYRILSGILVARLGGANAFSEYVLLTMIHITALSLAATLCSTPLMNLAPGLPHADRTALLRHATQHSQILQILLATIGIATLSISYIYNFDTIQIVACFAATATGLSAQTRRTWLQSSFQMKRALLADLPTPFIVIAATLLASQISNKPELGYWWGSTAAFLLASALMRPSKQILPKTDLSPTLQSKFDRSGRVMLLGSIANAGCSRIHPYIIQCASGTLSVASFGAAWTFLGPIRLLTGALGNLLRPRLSSLYIKGDAHRFKLITKRIYLSISTLGIALALCLALTGPEFVHLVFGKDFQAPPYLLVLACGYATLDAITTIQMMVLQISGASGPRSATRFRFQSAVASILIALPACSLWGAAGAFLSLLFAEGIYVVQAYLATRPKTAPRELANNFCSHPLSLH